MRLVWGGYFICWSSLTCFDTEYYWDFMKKDLGRFSLFLPALQGRQQSWKSRDIFAGTVIVVLSAGRRRKYMQNTKIFLAPRLCFILITNQRPYGRSSGAKGCISSAWVSVKFSVVFSAWTSTEHGLGRKEGCYFWCLHYMAAFCRLFCMCYNT